MAETRKYDPAAGNALAQALRAQLGEGVRPRIPGEPDRPQAAKPAQAEATTWVNLSLAAPPAPADDDADDDPDTD